MSTLYAVWLLHDRNLLPDCTYHYGYGEQQGQRELHSAGTNFLIRATAFQEAGWSPEYTLTEDYALGMELTRLHWHCRYVNEYLAIGEAPHETRNCFQQRSRWCKVNDL